MHRRAAQARLPPCLDNPPNTCLALCLFPQTGRCSDQRRMGFFVIGARFQFKGGKGLDRVSTAHLFGKVTEAHLKSVSSFDQGNTGSPKPCYASWLARRKWADTHAINDCSPPIAYLLTLSPSVFCHLS